MYNHLIQNPLTVLELQGAWRLFLAALFGMLLGLNRSIAGKHAGMRTYALVSLGSALFVIIGTLASLQLSFFAGINPLQIAGSIVLGIGFIGSGLAILHSQHSDHVGEITTATGIWVAAGIGMACGFGFYWLALAAMILSLIILSFFMKIEMRIRDHFDIGANVK